MFDLCILRRSSRVFMVVFELVLSHLPLRDHLQISMQILVNLSKFLFLFPLKSLENL